MGVVRDLTGLTVGRLTVTRLSHIGERNRRYWRCECQCGGVKVLKSDAITSGKTLSCGCLHLERARSFRRTHGATAGGASRTYRIWCGMKARCDTPTTTGFPSYGGSGVTYDAPWAEFSSFLEDMGECPSSKHSLDRIDGIAGYSKNNCRWATAVEQTRNQRTNITVVVRGVKQLARDVAASNGTPLPTFKKRLYTYRWPVEQACGLLPRVKGDIANSYGAAK